MVAAGGSKPVRTRGCVHLCSGRTDDADEQEEESLRQRRDSQDEETTWWSRIWSKASSEAAKVSEAGLLAFGVRREYELTRVAVEVCASFLL
jgi:hypothetical protein